MQVRMGVRKKCWKGDQMEGEDRLWKLSLSCDIFLDEPWTHQRSRRQLQRQNVSRGKICHNEECDGVFLSAQIFSFSAASAFASAAAFSAAFSAAVNGHCDLLS